MVTRLPKPGVLKKLENLRHGKGLFLGTYVYPEPSVETASWPAPGLTNAWSTIGCWVLGVGCWVFTGAES